MSEYFIKPSGDDAKDGLSEENAWASVTKAVQTLVAGDIAYIAPGTYRNTSGWVVANPGLEGNPIIFQGDPDCEHFANENPGYVRLSGCNSDELPSCAGHVFDYNNKNYITLKSVILDGMTSGHISATVYAYGGWDRKVEHCITVGGAYGFRGSIASHCLAVGAGYYGFFQGETDRCMALGCPSGFRDNDSVQCVAAGCKTGFLGEDSIRTNCIAVGGDMDFSGGSQKNCLAIGGSQGFSTGEQYNCIAMGCYYGFKGGTLSACKALYCFYTHEYTTGEPTGAKHIGWVNLRTLIELCRWLKPDLFFEKDFGDDSVLPDIEKDILGQPRRLWGGSIDVGPFEYSQVEMDWINYKFQSPGLKIIRKGIQEFQLPCEAGRNVKVSTWVKFDVLGDKPQLILEGNYITTQTATATGDGSIFEQLEVSATPTGDTVLTARLYQRDPTADKYALFSDLKVT